MNKQIVDIKTTYYAGIAHIVDINNPNYEQLWADFYLNAPTKELKSVISIQRADKYLANKLLYATLTEVDDLANYADYYYKYTLKKAKYLKIEVELNQRSKLPEIIDYAYNKSGYKVDTSEIIEYYDDNNFKLDNPKLALLFKIIK